jgi:hypothetical protein
MILKFLPQFLPRKLPKINHDGPTDQHHLKSFILCHMAIYSNIVGYNPS